MKDDKKLKVGDVSERTGLTVRTLHHWEAIGLLRARRTSSGHRQYGTPELSRVQQIVSLRALGLSLDEIRACLDDPAWSLEAAIDRHIERLDHEIARQRSLRLMLEAVRRTLADGDTKVDTLIQSITESIAMEKYYSKEQLETLAHRADELGDEGI